MCRLYRGPFIIVEFLFLWGINIYGWRSSGVNHVLIFEMDPRNHLSEQHIIELAAVFGVIWSVSMLSFLYSTELSIPAYINPLVLIVLMTAFLLNPTKTFRHEARFWTLKVLVCNTIIMCGYFGFFVFSLFRICITIILLFSYYVHFIIQYSINESFRERFYWLHSFM